LFSERDLHTELLSHDYHDCFAFMNQSS
jgi:hypothetical protein